MSTYDLEEQERLDALKDWWNRWQRAIYAAIATVVLAAAGYVGWQKYQENQANEAEQLFVSFKKTSVDLIAAKETKKVSEAADAIRDRFPATFQATDAQLIAAKAAFDAGDYASAKVHLQWVADQGRDTHRNIARLRLATALLESKNYDEALKVLEGVRDDAFASVAADLKGDIYAAQGRRDEARAAWQIAVDKADTRSNLKQFSQTKLDAFGGSTGATK